MPIRTLTYRCGHTREMPFTGRLQDQLLAESQAWHDRIACPACERQEQIAMAEGMGNAELVAELKREHRGELLAAARRRSLTYDREQQVRRMTRKRAFPPDRP
jgi:hypothetical protein